MKISNIIIYNHVKRLKNKNYNNKIMKIIIKIINYLTWIILLHIKVIPKLKVKKTKEINNNRWKIVMNMFQINLRKNKMKKINKL